MKKSKNDTVHKVVKALSKSFDVRLGDDNWVRITYYTTHGEEKNIEIPPSVNIAEWIRNEIDIFDESYAAYIWLDEFGHGKNGAPYDMADVLADQHEWAKTMERMLNIVKKASK